MAKTPPNPKDIFGPPPAKKGTTSDKGVYEKYIAAHPRLKQWSGAIYKYGLAYGVNPVYFASLINLESGGNPDAISSAGAIGLGQVIPGKFVPFLGRTITAADMHNPGLNLQVSAWYFGQGLDKNGQNYQLAYTKYYNPGYTGKVFGDIPKGYVVTGGTSPQDTANKAAATAAAKAQQPALALAGVHSRIDPFFLAYAGRLPSGKEAARFSGSSQYEITNYLADPKNNPRIFKSPIWLTHGPQYEALYKSVYGQNAKVNNNALLYGVVHNLDSTSFHQLLVDGKIPGQAAYTTSQEFKGNLANATNVYSQIYGRPTVHATNFLKSAVLGGWNQAQLESYLRSRPEYRSSGEYKARAIDIASSMGLVSSDMAKSIGQTALAQPAPEPVLPVPSATPPPQAATPTATATKPPPVGAAGGQLGG